MGLRRRASERGAVLVFVAPLFLALFAMTAIVVDIGNARQESRHVQASVDAAALAGARELPLDDYDAVAANRAVLKAAQFVNRNLTESANTPPEITCAADAPAGARCYTVAGAATVAIKTPYNAGPSAPLPFSLVWVEVCQPTATFFGGVIGSSSPTVCREAVARRLNTSGGYPMGLVVLHASECEALLFSGSSETILSSNGAVMVNSGCPTNALDATGASWRLHSSYIGVVGGAALAPCDPTMTDTCTSTEPTEGIAHFDDPFGTVAPPNPLPSNSGTHSCSPSSGTRVMQPGRYPTNCSFNNTAGYIFRPGVYYFDNGFSSSGNAPLVCSNTATNFPLPTPDACDGVTFIIGGGAVTLNGTAKVFLPPPSTGSYAGISIYQLSSQDSKINGTNDFVLGTIYAPNAYYLFTGSGGGSNGVNINGMVVTRTAEINGSFYFNINVPESAPQSRPEDEFGLWL